ncbi:hypothetical protein Q2K19_01080 [Micromonospora soli]|uniref:hypothetical protein n=1 Tax=Micromonospora sp. NBRC 110009 TaxID=3061627 RepID=UPI002671FB51|nr:hypothetical protein [Micromonospora sp. NBRC 110009]WKT99140.1 hypothetical protein Q2K19_01080 [Micromonospora sp. NBRC 110009]
MNDDGAAPPPEDPVLRDDELLDALRHGTPPPADDPVATLLAGWHAAIERRAARFEATSWPTADGRRTSDLAAPLPDPDPTALHSAARDADAAPPPQGGSPTATVRSRPTRQGAGRTPRRRGRVLAGAALTLVTLTAGVWLGAARAEPDELLWPVTELVWTERAQSLVAEREIDRLLDQARRDLGAGRYAEARADLERAGALLADLGDDQRAARLRSGIEDLWQRLPAPDAPVSQAPPPEPGAPVASPSPGPDQAEEGAAPPSGVETAPAAAEPTRPGSPLRPDLPDRTEPTSPGTAPARTAPTGERPGHTAPTAVRPAPAAPRRAPRTAGADAPGGPTTAGADAPGGPARSGAGDGRSAADEPPDRPDTVRSRTRPATVAPPADPGQPSTAP